ncbi:two-component response regulator-like APRR2 isoform X4 [Abrus precatorius]|uniref:Two-component response regulator-like APRR2 isoform X4 n=1 Tax=Abrus precatorius TaxID=3816 RepID=A0A8B8JTB4_ABRPR|nr:two-component response regulator-like APRR2 isoform X4 [Abrus precatorius]
MVCTANDLQEWKDFPKGLKVLLLEGDRTSAAEIRAKLEAMDYNVYTFCDVNEALSAISSGPESFHIAIVEVSSSSQGGFKFLENAKDLPTIMTSNNHCLNTMMKCIALGAVEFLNKPLSEDKLRNIWQHVVHKAFSAGESILSESLKPIKETVMAKLQTDNEQHEEDFADASKNESIASPHTQNTKGVSNIERHTTSSNKVGIHGDSYEIKINRKKMKVDWTPELHKNFVKAVEQLGIDQAIPSRILELMKVEGLTRHNVASHLQKYRMHKRHILPKEDDRKWLNQRDTMQRSYCLQRPIMAFPPYHSNHTLSLAPVYPMWGQSGNQTAGMHIWHPPGYPLWQQPTENWQWKPFPGMHADAWGCPVLPVQPPQAPCFPYSSNMPALLNADAVDHTCSMPQSSVEHYPAEEVVDKVVKEAINKPWLPLPLGLKPPSTDSVMAELSRQGISSIPPATKGSNSG